jgi:hypothetical protein
VLEKPSSKIIGVALSDMEFIAGLMSVAVALIWWELHDIKKEVEQHREVSEGILSTLEDSRDLLRKITTSGKIPREDE